MGQLVMTNILTKSEAYVLNVINQNPGVQNDELHLLSVVWEHDGYDETKSLYWNLTRGNLTHPETVARARRKLHEYGLIEYSETALRRRTKRFKEETERHGESLTAKIIPKLEEVEIDGEKVMRYV